MKPRIAKRLSDLEARIIEDSKLGYFETGQVMTADEWDAQAPQQQAQLLVDHALMQEAWNDKHDSRLHSSCGFMDQSGSLWNDLRATI